jgi:hypothetical protein
MSIASLVTRASSTVLPDVELSDGRALLRFEALGLLGVCLALYAHFGSGWGLFALLFLVPDIGMAGYLVNRRVGALSYNLTHSEILPLVLGAIGLLAPSDLMASIALIWLAHIGFDRALGYGLKSTKGFRYTHLGQIGAGPR